MLDLHRVTTASPELDIGEGTTAGKRVDNQDALSRFESPFGKVFLVADGMGGHRGGAVASALAASQAGKIMSSWPHSLSPEQALTATFQEINSLILAQSQGGDEAVAGMGSTIVALLLRQTAEGLLALGAHVGDSRLYLLRGDSLFLLTRDHTAVQKMIDARILTEEQAFDHPQASVLTRVLGLRAPVEVDLTTWRLLKPGDKLLLCSDGLSGYLQEEEIRQTMLLEGTAQATSTRLINLALHRGSDDNISAIVVRVVEREGVSAARG